MSFKETVLGEVWRGCHELREFLETGRYCQEKEVFVKTSLCI